MPEVDKREVLTAVLSGAWHALKSYEYGNTAPDLAAEMAESIEGAARMLGIEIEGVQREVKTNERPYRKVDQASEPEKHRH